MSRLSQPTQRAFATALVLAGSWAGAAVHLRPAIRTAQVGDVVTFELRGVEDEGAQRAARPHWTWRLLEPGAGALAQPSNERGDITVLRRPKDGKLRLEITNTHPPYQKVRALIHVLPGKGWNPDVTRTLDLVHPGWSLEQPSMRVLGDLDQIPFGTKAPVRVQAMRFLEAPDLGPLHRTALMATDQGLFAVSKAGQAWTVDLVPGTGGESITRVAVPPGGSAPASGLRFAYLQEHAGPGRGPCRVFGVFADGATRLLAGGQHADAGEDDVCQGGAPAETRLFGIRALAVDAAGNVGVADAHTLLRIPADGGDVVPLAGSYAHDPGAEHIRTQDGAGEEALFKSITSMTGDPSGDGFFVTDADCVRKVTGKGEVTTVLGTNYEGQDDRDDPADNVPYDHLLLPEAGESLVVEGQGGGLQGPRDIQAVGNTLLLAMSYEEGSVVAFDLGTRRLTTLLRPRRGAPQAGPLRAYRHDLPEGQWAELGQTPKFLACDSRGLILVKEHAQPAQGAAAGPEALVCLNFPHLWLGTRPAVAQAPAAGAEPREEEKDAGAPWGMDHAMKLPAGLLAALRASLDPVPQRQQQQTSLPPEAPVDDLD